MFPVRVGGLDGQLKARFGQAMVGWENPGANLNTLSRYLSQDLFTFTQPAKKPSAKAAEENPALLVNYFKAASTQTNSNGRPIAKLTIEDAQTMLPYFLNRAGFPKSTIEHCLAEPAEKVIHLIIEPEDKKGRSNIPLLVNAIDNIQNYSSDFKTLSKVWTGSTEIPYNPLNRSFMFLGHRVMTYEGLEEYLDMASYQNIPSFWGTARFGERL